MVMNGIGCDDDVDEDELMIMIRLQKSDETE